MWSRAIPVSEAAEDDKRTIRGLVEPIEALRSPLSQVECAGYHVRSVRKSGGSSGRVADTRVRPLIVDVIHEEKAFADFWLIDEEDSTKRIYIDTSEVRIVLQGYVDAAAEDREAFLKANWTEIPPSHVDEVALTPGHRITVRGCVMVEPDPEAAIEAGGYRDQRLATRQRLIGDKAPVVISDWK